jgi:uncharacterized protein (DUF1778 family)
MRTRPKATKLNEAECLILTRAAKRAGVTESQFIRDAILKAADEPMPTEPKVALIGLDFEPISAPGFEDWQPSARLEAAMSTLRNTLLGATDQAFHEFLGRIGVPRPNEPD